MKPYIQKLKKVRAIRYTQAMRDGTEHEPIAIRRMLPGTRITPTATYNANPGNSAGVPFLGKKYGGSSFSSHILDVGDWIVMGETGTYALTDHEFQSEFERQMDDPPKSEEEVLQECRGQEHKSLIRNMIGLYECKCRERILTHKQLKWGDHPDLYVGRPAGRVSGVEAIECLMESVAALAQQYFLIIAAQFRGVGAAFQAAEIFWAKSREASSWISERYWRFMADRAIEEVAIAHSRPTR